MEIFGVNARECYGKYITCGNAIHFDKACNPPLHGEGLARAGTRENPDARMW
jgi:hypothetical protein